MKNRNNTKKLLAEAFLSFGKSLSEIDESVIQFIIENIDSTKFQWLANQILGFEDITHKSISMESIKKIVDYKEDFIQL